jgi:predicted dehydrogenase
MAASSGSVRSSIANRPVRFGIVGCGGIAGIHADALKALEQEGIAQLAGGADPSEASRTKFAEKWGVPTFATLDEMLKRDDIDACTITSPSGMHGDQVIQCAKAGKHVLCEKPLDLKLAKADAAIAAAKENGVTLGGIFQQRFNPAVQKVRRAIDGGYFGKIVLAHCETPWYRSQAYYDSGKWRGTWALDCGVLSNQAPHVIDLLIWLAGDVEQLLCAACDCGKERTIEAETVAVASARLATGALATITGTTLAFDGLPQRLMICGTEGSCQFSSDTLAFFKTSKPFEQEIDAADETPRALAAESRASDPLAMSNAGHMANIRDFAQALREGRPPAVTGDDYRKVTRVLNLIYETAGVGPFAKR